MELTKKLISLTMAVIMTVTATPVLQASDLVNLDMTELNELRQEILPSITDPNNFITNGETEEMPTLKELQDRYKEVIKRYKKLNTRKARKAVEKKKQEALEIANQMKEFDEFIDEDEKAEVAFYTFVFDSTLKADTEMRADRNIRAVITTIGGLAAFDFGSFIIGEWLLDLSEVGSLLVGLGFSAVLITATLVFWPKSMGTGDVINRGWNGMKLGFLFDPFYSVGIWYNRDDFATLYNDKEARQILCDVVNIEYYVSRNPSKENMMYRIFPHTLYWTKMNPAQQEEYLHKAAEILKKEATEYKLPTYKPEWER